MAEFRITGQHPNDLLDLAFDAIGSIQVVLRDKLPNLQQIQTRIGRVEKITHLSWHAALGSAFGFRHALEWLESFPPVSTAPTPIRSPGPTVGGEPRDS